MTYLVYCIMRAGQTGGGPVTGMGGTAVSFVTAHGLSAAVSEFAAGVSAPPVADLLAYGRVVDELHGRQAVIPLRYGCFLEGVPAILRVLEERKLPYDTLLAELDGHVEMGIRILLPGQGAAPAPVVPPVDGSRYLAMRKAHYREQEQEVRHHEDLLHGYIQAFAGLHDQHRTETATRNGAVVLSAYFLILQSRITQFRETFRHVAGRAGAKALLSGPWPPYNFAAPDLLPGAAAGPGGAS